MSKVFGTEEDYHLVASLREERLPTQAHGCRQNVIDFVLRERCFVYTRVY